MLREVSWRTRFRFAILIVIHRQTKQYNFRLFTFDISLLQLRCMKWQWRFKRASRVRRKTFLYLRFSLTRSVSTPVKSLKVAHSDTAVRIRFHNRGDVFSTPSSTPETPSSWPLRPGLTGLGPSCVADHVVSVSVPNVFRNWRMKSNISGVNETTVC